MTASYDQETNRSTPTKNYNSLKENMMTVAFHDNTQYMYWFPVIA